MRVSTWTIPLAAALAMACSGEVPEPGVLVVKVFVAPPLSVDCLELSARNQAGAERTTRAAKKDGPLRVGVLKSAELSGDITFVARGFVGPGCQEPLTPNGSSEPLIEEVPDFGSREVSIIVAGQDRDGDGYVAQLSGGPDCDDDNPNARPGLAEICGDGLDNDCRGGADCADSACAAPCAGSGDGGFPYRPSNFEPAGLPAPTSPLTLRCRDAFFDSTTLDGGWCGQPGPAVRIVDQDGGSQAVVLAFRDLLVDQGGVLRLTGNRPVILAVLGDVTVRGHVNAGATRERPGPGGGASCSAGAGRDGDTQSMAGGGGGGGAFAGDGGSGGPGVKDGNTAPGGAGGIAEGAASLVPLRGGCSGGSGGGPSGGAPGGGGGGLQISASGVLRVQGRISAQGGGGGGGLSGSGDANGGGGGGSGGAILLEAATIQVDGTARVTANGGGGGQGGAGEGGSSGEDGSTTNTSSAAMGGRDETGAGGNGGDGASAATPATSGARGSANQGGGGGGGGGGGSVGRIRLNVSSGCALSAAISDVFSPVPTSNAGPDAGCP